MLKRAEKADLPRHFVSYQTLFAKIRLTLGHHADHIAALLAVASSR